MEEYKPTFPIYPLRMECGYRDIIIATITGWETARLEKMTTDGVIIQTFAGNQAYRYIQYEITAHELWEYWNNAVAENDLLLFPSNINNRVQEKQQLCLPQLNNSLADIGSFPTSISNQTEPTLKVNFKP